MAASSSVKTIPWFLWYTSTTIFLLIWPSFKYGTAIWNQPKAQIIPHILLTCAHLLAGIILSAKIVQNKRVRYPEIIFLTLGLFGLIVLGLFQLRSPFSRLVLPLTLALSIGSQVAGLFLLSRPSRPSNRTTLLGAAACTLLAFLLVATNPGKLLERTSGLARKSASQLRSNASTGPNTVTIESEFYKLDAAFFENYVEAPLLPGGGLTQFGDDLLLVTGEGYFYLLDLDTKPGDLIATKLGLKVPSNYFDFVKEAPGSALKYHFWFRVADAYAKFEGEHADLFSTYHYWKSETKTFVVRLARLSGTKEEILASSPDLKWEVLFESTPDLKIKPNQRSDIDFAGLQIGGRIQELDNHTLLFSVGDHEHDGWNFAENYPQDPNASYGKMIKLDLTTGRSQIFSTGHRNPQGLYLDPQGNIWSTEHGPQGGGELNLIKEGRNYGWPYVTFGTEYGMREWPNGRIQGDHTGFEFPIYSWSHSKGLSGLIGLEKDLFPIWKGDLILSTLSGNVLLRVRMREGRAVTIESMEIGKRIRDVTEDEKGRIVLWTDKGQVVVIQPSDKKDIVIPPDFVACAACHSINPGEVDRIGPNLSGIMGREIATSQTFRYSPGLKNHSGKWTKKNLDEFLRDPQAFAPQTPMVYPGVEDPERRQALIAFLESI